MTYLFPSCRDRLLTQHFSAYQNFRFRLRVWCQPLLRETAWQKEITFKLATSMFCSLHYSFGRRRQIFCWSFAVKHHVVCWQDSSSCHLHFWRNVFQCRNNLFAESGDATNSIVGLGDRIPVTLNLHSFAGRHRVLCWHSSLDIMSMFRKRGDFQAKTIVTCVDPFVSCWPETVSAQKRAESENSRQINDDKLMTQSAVSYIERRFPHPW